MSEARDFEHREIFYPGGLVRAPKFVAFTHRGLSGWWVAGAGDDEAFLKDLLRQDHASNPGIIRRMGDGPPQGPPVASKPAFRPVPDRLR